MNIKSKDNTIIRTLLLALIPYTKQNIYLTFKPNLFFNELEKTSGISKTKLQKSYYRARNENIIDFSNNQPKLTLKGQMIIQPFIAQKIQNDAQLMVIFDIPENLAGRRQRLRNLLKQLDFKQIQLSVWVSDKEHRKIVFDFINEIELQQFVQIYEAAKIIE